MIHETIEIRDMIEYKGKDNKFKTLQNNLEIILKGFSKDFI